MKTKQDLLAKMESMSACEPAFAWVEAREGSAQEILLGLDRVSCVGFWGESTRWQSRPFASGCADRLPENKHSASFACVIAANKCVSAALAGAGAADCIGDCIGDERKIQVAELHELVKKVCQ